MAADSPAAEPVTVLERRTLVAAGGSHYRLSNGWFISREDRPHRQAVSGDGQKYQIWEPGGAIGGGARFRGGASSLKGALALLNAGQAQLGATEGPVAREHIHLAPEAARAFSEALARPPEVNERLASALRSVPADLAPRHGRYVIVSGDWLLEERGRDPLYQTGYAAEVDDRENWSGGVCPWVTRSVAEAIVRDQERLIREGSLVAEGDPQLRWDGGGIVYTMEGSDAERCEPDAQGRYPVSFGWTWQVVPVELCRSIVFASHVLKRALRTELLKATPEPRLRPVILPAGTEVTTVSQSGASVELRVVRGPGRARRLGGTDTLLAVPPAQLRWALSAVLERSGLG